MSLNALIIEQNRGDAVQIQRSLETTGSYGEVTVVHDLRSAREYLAHGVPDIIVANIQLDDGQALKSLPRDLHEAWPVVVLADATNPSEAVAAIKAGALDCVPKTPEAIAELPVILQRALCEWEKTLVARRGERLKKRLINTVLAAPDFVGIAAKDGRLVFINRAGRRLVGIGAVEDISTVRMHDFFPDWRVGSLVYDRSHQRSGDLIWADSKVRHRDGRVEPVSLAVLAHVGEESGIESYTILAKESTDRVRFEKDVGLLEARLERQGSLETSGQLAILLGQHLSDALAPIIAYGTGALADASPEARGRIEALVTAAEDATKLVNDLLHMGMQRDTTPRLLNVAPLLKRAIDMTRICAPPNVEVKMRIDPGCPAILADPSHIYHLIVSLCLNAFHAMSDTGGLLEAAMQCVQVTGGAGSGSILSEGEYLQLEIRDNGPGIPASTANALFDPLTDSEPTPNRQGLALWMARRIVKRNRGDIHVDTAPATGTTVRILLPATRNAD